MLLALLLDTALELQMLTLFFYVARQLRWTYRLPSLPACDPSTVLTPFLAVTLFYCALLILCGQHSLALVACMLTLDAMLPADSRSDQNEEADNFVGELFWRSFFSEEQLTRQGWTEPCSKWVLWFNKKK
jgi:hypothetical protein